MALYREYRSNIFEVHDINTELVDGSNNILIQILIMNIKMIRII